MTQPTQPSPRRTPGGFRAHAVAGIVFAILCVVLINVRPFSPWYPPGATVKFVAEIISPSDGTLEIGKAIYGGISIQPEGRVQVAKSATPRTVSMKVRVDECDALLFRPHLTGDVLELRDQIGRAHV